MDFTNISEQMRGRLQAILPALRVSHGVSTADGLPPVDVSIAENELLRTEMLDLTKAAINAHLQPKDLAYPEGFGGDPELLASLARFFNAHFQPANPVEPGHILATSGAGNALDALLCAVCNDGDRVLVAGPCWEGFAPYFRIHANVTPVFVTAPSLDAATRAGILDALMAAYHGDEDPSRIKAVVLTNPNNPLGRCYDPEVLRECLRFCNLHDLHLISDEVYALSSFRTDPNSAPFTSVLSLPDVGDSGASSTQASRVHVVWSLSKDLGCGGLRLGCIVSQANAALRLGSGLASFWQVSSLASVLATAILNSAGLDDLLQRNSEALRESYERLTDGLTRLGLQYIPATHGMFVFAKLIAGACTAPEEAAAVEKLARLGLIVAPGQRFSPGGAECGWIRITFAVVPERISRVLEVLAQFQSLRE